MKTLLLFALNMFIVGYNVDVSEGAQAQEPGVYSFRIPCGKTETVNDMLKTKYREELLFKGLANTGLFKFWTNEKTSTFTVGLEANGLICVVVAGRYLIKLPQGTSL